MSLAISASKYFECLCLPSAGDGEELDEAAGRADDGSGDRNGTS